MLGVERPRIGLLSIGEEASKGTPLIVEAHAALRDRVAAGGRYEWVGNVEGNEVTTGKADVVVTDGFTGNVALKLMEGVSETMLRAIRDVATSSRRAKTGGLLLRPALLEFRDALDPESAGGAYLLGLRRLGVVPHGRFSRRGIAQAILLAARGVSEDIVGVTHAALEAAGALREAPPAADGRPSGGASSVVGAMTRDEVFALIQSHLADELDLDPARIDETTRFREDLEADSLDLYTLVQELEDSYGVKMSDEQAARILTVGQAVEFVLDHAPSAR